MNAPAAFITDESPEPFPLADFANANADAPDAPEWLAALAVLLVGESYTIHLGAGGSTTTTRIG